MANEPRFAAVPPARIVPMLADEGVYLGSESSMARVLREHGQNARRGRAKAPKATRPPTTHIATAPGQIWCWDMTYLPAELQAGVAALPAGKRRNLLDKVLAQQVLTLFNGRILAFDARAAHAYAQVHAAARASGNSIGFADGAIAAIASAHGFALATRNTRDFAGTGIELVDPWAAAVKKP